MFLISPRLRHPEGNAVVSPNVSHFAVDMPTSPKKYNDPISMRLSVVCHDYSRWLLTVGSEQWIQPQVIQVVHRIE